MGNIFEKINIQEERLNLECRTDKVKEEQELYLFD